MHKHLGLVTISVFLVCLVMVPGMFDMLFALVFVGMVPFTSYTIPPLIMLLCYVTFITLGIYLLANGLATASNVTRREIASRERARKQVLRYTKHYTHSRNTVAQKQFHTAPEHD